MPMTASTGSMPPSANKSAIRNVAAKRVLPAKNIIVHRQTPGHFGSRPAGHTAIDSYSTGFIAGPKGPAVGVDVKRTTSVNAKLR